MYCIDAVRTGHNMFSNAARAGHNISPDCKQSATVFTHGVSKA